MSHRELHPCFGRKPLSFHSRGLDLSCPGCTSRFVSNILPLTDGQCSHLLIQMRAKFFSRIPQNLVFKELSWWVSHQVAQIIEPLGSTRKIFQSKDLAAARRRRPSPLGIRMMRHFGCGAQGQMSQRRGIGLWKNYWMGQFRQAQWSYEFLEKVPVSSVSVSARSPAGFALRRRPSAEWNCFLFCSFTRPWKGRSSTAMSAFANSPPRGASPGREDE